MTRCASYPIADTTILLIGNIKELLQKLDAFCFNYQHVDCLYTLFNYRFGGKIVVKSGQFFDTLQRAVHFNRQNRGVDRMLSIAKKRLLRKNYKKHLFSSIQKTNSTQTSGTVFGNRIEQVKKTKFELELKKILDCFLDGYGNYSSSLVSFKIKSFSANLFLNLKILIGSANDIVITPTKNPSAIKKAITKKTVPT